VASWILHLTGSEWGNGADVDIDLDSLDLTKLEDQAQLALAVKKAMDEVKEADEDTAAYEDDYEES
jgi:hypothetical protein